MMENIPALKQKKLYTHLDELLFTKHHAFYIFCVLLVISFKLAAQDKTNFDRTDFESYSPVSHSQKVIANSEWKPCISPFAEILGKGFFSLNVDFRKKETRSISIGVAGIEEGASPNMMAYVFMGKKHRVEAGGGLSGNIYQGSLANLFVHGVIGYRYQKKRGIFFRCGFTPMAVIPIKTERNFALIPWVGLSVGYSF